MCEGMCLKCEQMKELTEHHIKPRRHYGNGKGNWEVILLCRECHDMLERLIPFDRQPEEFYYDILVFFGIDPMRIPTIAASQIQSQLITTG